MASYNLTIMIMDVSAAYDSCVLTVRKRSRGKQTR